MNDALSWPVSSGIVSPFYAAWLVLWFRLLSGMEGGRAQAIAVRRRFLISILGDSTTAKGLRMLLWGLSALPTLPLILCMRQVLVDFRRSEAGASSFILGLEALRCIFGFVPWVLSASLQLLPHWGMLCTLRKERLLSAIEGCAVPCSCSCSSSSFS